MVASFRKLPVIFFFVLAFKSILLSAQTDSMELNPQNSAKFDSASIIFLTEHYKPEFIADLPAISKETSGMLFFGGQLWTHNDSGNLPEIYQIDSTNGKVLRTIVIGNSANNDWESLTQDDSNVYIGDFGNNAGNRKDLHILKLAKKDLLNPGNDTVNATYIYFFYPDQTDFINAVNRNNFDCEAFFYHNDSLHLFSKNWSDLQTRHYVLSATPGNYKARFAGSFNAGGLITDASINAKGNIVLLGYKNIRGRRYSCFAWLLSGYQGSDYFSGEKKRIELGSALYLGQAEGIVLKNDNSGWISSESIRIKWIYKPAKLFGFNFGDFFSDNR